MFVLRSILPPIKMQDLLIYNAYCIYFLDLYPKFFIFIRNIARLSNANNA